MKKILLLLFAITTLLNAYDTKYNEEFIKIMKQKYENRLPIYENEELTLIGLYSINKKTLILEYEIDKDFMENKIFINKNKKEIFSNNSITKYLNLKFKKNLDKCNVYYNNLNIIKNGTQIIYRYYLYDKFYGQIKINEKTCGFNKI